jgi:hypothetical protein
MYLMLELSYSCWIDIIEHLFGFYDPLGYLNILRFDDCKQAKNIILCINRTENCFHDMTLFSNSNISLFEF